MNLSRGVAKKSENFRTKTAVAGIDREKLKGAADPRSLTLMAPPQSFCAFPPKGEWSRSSGRYSTLRDFDSQKNRVSTPLGFLRFGTPRRLSEEFAACWAQLGSHLGLELIELSLGFPVVAWR